MIEHKQYPNSFAYLEVDNKYAHAKIALQGAHVFEYKAVDKPALLWCSKKANFEKGKAIRGGVPICFPWFGKHEEDSTLPQHGFARTSLWKVIEEKERDDGTTHIKLELTSTKESLKVWAYAFSVILEVHIGSMLSLSLQIHNSGTKPFKVSTALHTYLAISSVDSVVVHGLEDTPYYDALSDTMSTHSAPLQIDKEIDRVYRTNAEHLILKDVTHSTRIESKGSHSLVVWNPWKEKSKSMKDMCNDSYETMLCLETANAKEDARWIAPSKVHHLDVTYIL